MKIACCTLEMITLIFLLFVGFNGGFQYLDSVQDGIEPASATELLTLWGEPDEVATAVEAGFSSAQLTDVEIWSYTNPQRTAIVRDEEIISIREG